MNSDITLNGPEPKWDFPEISRDAILALSRAGRLGDLIDLIRKLENWEDREKFERAYFQKLRAKFSPS